MKSIKNYLILLLAVTTFVFSACEESTDLIEPAIPNTVNTFAPEINGNQVTFKGRVLQPNNVKEYGFMWYESNGSNNSEIQRVVVGTGNFNGDFDKIMLDLPRGSNLVVCAFIQYQSEFNDSSEGIGEEIDFILD